MNNQLKELSKFRYLKKEYISLNANFNDLKVSSNELKEELSSLNRKNSEIKKIHQESIEALEQIKERNKLLQTIIDTTTNSEIKKLYDEIYDEEIEIANRYRNWALLIFAIISFLIFINFFLVNIPYNFFSISIITPKEGLDPILKGLIFLTLSAPAWYLTKESSKHRQVAYKAKMLGTELAAFPLYAREFKDEERLELRKSLADRFFGQELYGSSTPKVDNSASSTEQIKLLAEMNKVTVEAIKVQQTLLGKKE